MYDYIDTRGYGSRRLLQRDGYEVTRTDYVEMLAPMFTTAAWAALHQKVVCVCVCVCVLTCVFVRECVCVCVWSC